MIAHWDKDEKWNLFYYFNLSIYLTTWSFYLCWKLLKCKDFFLFSKNISMQLKSIYYFFPYMVLKYLFFIILLTWLYAQSLIIWNFEKHVHYICSPPDIITIPVIIRFTLWLLLKIIVLYRMWVLRMISSRCQMCSVCHWLK